jgi:hypothetical protein
MWAISKHIQGMQLQPSTSDMGEVSLSDRISLPQHFLPHLRE